MSETEPEYAARFARQKIKVAGTAIDVLILGDGSELAISENLSDDMDRVSAQLAYWGSVLAEASAEKVQVDAFYRRFRASCAEAVLQRDPKAAEWKVKNAIEATDGFIQHKNAIAMAERNVGILEAMVRAFDKKANQLQSKGARVRSELNATGMTTPEVPRTPRGWNLSGRGSDSDDERYVSSPAEGVRRPSQEEKIRRMEEINSARDKSKAARKKGKRT
jgi:hypothetical protein